MDNEKQLRDMVKRNILKQQQITRTQYDKKRKVATTYNIGNLVMIKRAQFGTGVKLRTKFFGPYRVITIHPNERYQVQKIGSHEGPQTTSTAADMM